MDSERCVWHAEHADKPTDELAATVGNGDLVGAHARRTDLTSVSFSEGSNLGGSTLSDATFMDATLTDANLREAALTDADLYNSTLKRAKLEGALLSHSNLGRVDMTDT